MSWDVRLGSGATTFIHPSASCASNFFAARLPRQFDALLVCRLRRLGRNLHAGRLQLHVLAAIAQFERDRIRECMHAGLARAQAQGTRSGRRLRRITDADLMFPLTPTTAPSSIAIAGPRARQPPDGPQCGIADKDANPASNNRRCEGDETTPDENRIRGGANDGNVITRDDKMWSSRVIGVMSEGQTESRRSKNDR